MAAASGQVDVLTLAEELRPALLRASRQLRREAQRAGVSALDAQLLNALRKHPGAGVAEAGAGEQMTRHDERSRQASGCGPTGSPGTPATQWTAAVSACGSRPPARRPSRRSAAGANDWLAGPAGGDGMRKAAPGLASAIEPCCSWREIASVAGSVVEAAAVDEPRARPRPRRRFPPSWPRSSARPC